MKQNKQLRIILRDLEKEAWKDYPVKKKAVKFPIQKTLFELNNPRKSHISMGLFYELLGICLFGGRLADSAYLTNDKGEDVEIKPDVINREEKRMVESKGCRTGHELNLLDGQIGRYTLYQSIYPDFKIYYSVWRHSLRNIKSYSKHIEKLFEDLCDKTLCCLLFPFTVILKLHQAHDLFRRYESEKWDYCTRVSSGFMNMIFSDPKDFFKKLGLDQKQFDVQYCYLPEGVTVSQFEINRFPIAFVRDLRYEERIAELIDFEPPF